MGKFKVRYFIENSRLYKEYNNGVGDIIITEVKCNVENLLVMVDKEKALGWLE